MGECEVCGGRPAVKKAVIEGVAFEVCAGCARHGKEIVERSYVKGAARGPARVRDDAEMVDDFSDVLKRRISSLGVRYEDLARKINENESYLRRVVRGETIPGVRLARKLEKELKVKLIEDEER